MVINRNSGAGVLSAIEGRAISALQVIRCESGKFFIIGVIDFAGAVWATGLPIEGSEQVVFLTFQSGDLVELLEEVQTPLQAARCYRACRDQVAESQGEPSNSPAKLGWTDDF